MLFVGSTKDENIVKMDDKLTYGRTQHLGRSVMKRLAKLDTKTKLMAYWMSLWGGTRI